jgi:hypothetical protein
MKVAFFNSHVLWPSHYETELEIIQEHLEKGDEVIQLFCENQLPACDQNPFFVPSVCNLCQKIRKEGKKLLKGNLRSIPLPEPSLSEKEAIAALPFKFESIKELQALKIENFDIGFSVVSSLISFTRNPKPLPSDFQPALFSFITSAAGLYFGFRSWLKQNKPDVVFLFNGRLAHTRAIMRACQAEGVHFVIHERGANKDKYALFPDNSPHDLKFIQSEVIRLWNESDPEQREKEGRSFYELTASGQEIGWFSFTNNQKNILPENWQPDNYNVVIFSSSEDEFASLSEEWHNHIYPSQIDGIKRIAKDLLSEKKIHFFLRVHPNLKKVDNDEKRALYALEAPNLTIIKAESEVSSYKLLKEASLVLTFGSTMGIEAVYQGKPSILAGRSLYSELGATYNPSNHEEVVSLLKNPPAALDKTGAIIYGHYCKTFGTNFRFYKPDSLDKGSFAGVYLNRNKRSTEKWIDKFFELPLIETLSTRLYGRLKTNRLKRFTKIK